MNKTLLLNSIAFWFLANTAVPAQNILCSSNSVMPPSAKFSSFGTKQILFIPVVFHIVQNGDRGAVADQQIYQQLSVINEDFSRTNSDAVETVSLFQSIAASADIQFFLAERDGLPGINRTVTTHGPFANDDLHNSIKGGQDGWDSKRFLNIWVADLAPGILGYGSAPGTDTFKDGVAVHYEYFGKLGRAKPPYNLGRTLTHEIGHWLGLSHPWGDGGCDSDDGLTDTPLQDRPTEGCDLTLHSCGTLNMVQNFMNTSFDACMNCFTEQQVNTMRETLFNYRPLSFSVNPPLITQISEAQMQIQILPNPTLAGSIAWILIPNGLSGNLSISISDLMGKDKRHFLVAGPVEKIELDLQGFTNGIYNVTVASAAFITTKKILLRLP